MSPENTIKECLLYYPNLFGNRADVMNHLFLTIGNGYSWVNGELVENCIGKDKGSLSIESGLDQLVDYIKDYIGDLMFDSLIEHELRKFIKLGKVLEEETLEDLVDSLSGGVISRVIRLIENDIKPMVRFEETYKEPLRLVKTQVLYPLFDSSKIMCIPSDITSEWKSCIIEFLNYLRTSRESAVCDYREKYSTEIESIWKKLS